MFGARVPDSELFRQSVGQQIIDRIRERTREENIDRKGRGFRGYSDSYVESLRFRAAGKDPGSVNLTLTGEMLTLMDVIDSTSTTITIGFTDRTDQRKAHGHITGSKRGPKVKRDFFGLPNTDYKIIAGANRLPPVEPSDDEPGILSTLVTLQDLFGGQS
jgi:hypothetical protein